MDWHSIQGEEEILLVASCYRNWDKLRPNGPLGSYADCNFTSTFGEQKKTSSMFLLLNENCTGFVF